MDEALGDLARLREHIGVLSALKQHDDLRMALEAVDSAFEAEVLELTLIRTCEQAGIWGYEDGSGATESSGGASRPATVWWLFESLLRSLHAGVEALAQVLNLTFELGVAPESTRLKHDVCAALGRSGRRRVEGRLRSLCTSSEYFALDAFVCRERLATLPHRYLPGSDGDRRPGLETGEFTHRHWPHGPWAAREAVSIIDGVRRGVLDVLRESNEQLLAESARAPVAPARASLLVEGEGA